MWFDRRRRRVPAIRRDLVSTGGRDLGDHGKTPSPFVRKKATGTFSWSDYGLYQAVSHCRPGCGGFGSKDFQQVQVIRKMVRDLCMNLTIEAVETVRESDGLARSSRNAYLTEEERRLAPVLYRVLHETREAVRDGKTSSKELISRGISQIEAAGGRIDYLEIVDPETLEAADPVQPDSHMLVAAFSGVLD